MYGVHGAEWDNSAVWHAIVYAASPHPLKVEIVWSLKYIDDISNIFLCSFT